MISLQSRITKNQNLLTSKIDGKIVLMGVDSGKYLALDDIGTDIWERIDRFPLMHDLCNALAQDYGADSETIQADVRKLVSILDENNVILVDH